MGIIGYLSSTAIAFFVVMGDLGPPMVAKLGGIELTANLRMVRLLLLPPLLRLPLLLLLLRLPPLLLLLPRWS